MGVIKGDTRSLDYSSCGFQSVSAVPGIRITPLGLIRRTPLLDTRTAKEQN